MKSGAVGDPDSWGIQPIKSQNFVKTTNQKPCLFQETANYKNPEFQEEQSIRVPQSKPVIVNLLRSPGIDS
jgi:hypothetical protein